MLAGASFELPVAIAPEATVTHIKRHTGRPSLRLILADAFFFAISLLVAMAWIAAISAMAAIVIIPLFFIFKYLFQIVLNCTP